MNNIIKNTCPSISEYEKFLKNELNDTELFAIENHLKQCELCKESIEGYKKANIHNINELFVNIDNPFIKKAKPKKSFSRTFQSAASIIIIIGLTLAIRFILNDPENSYQVQYSQEFASFSQFENIQQSGNKKLTKKTSEQYIYIGEENTFLLNDQLIKSDDMLLATSMQPQIEKIIVQVESSNIDESESLIKRIKEQRNIPVLSFRNIK